MQGLTLLSLTTIALTVCACSRRDDDRAISAAPDLAAASSTAEKRDMHAPPLAAPAPDDVPGASRNPLAMQLKHDGVPAGASSAETDSADPCAPPERTGPLAMRLRHDGPRPPGQRNPLCMRIK